MPKGKKTILLVEDEPIIALAQSKILERHGYNVIVTHDGPMAIDTACADGTGIDLVLMDIDLGRGMDGTQAAQAILQKRDIPVVFLSSHTEPAIVEKTDAITSYGYVTKDSGETVLIASLKMAFRLHDAHITVQQHRMEVEASYEELLKSEQGLVEHEKALRETEMVIRNIIDNLPFGIHQYHLDENGRLVFERANPAADLILKVENSRYIGQTIEEAFPLLAGTELPDRFRQTCAGGTPWQTEQIEYQDERIRGVYEILAFQTEPGRMVAVFRDVTERKLVDRALRESEEKFRSITEQMRDVIFITDTRGVNTYVSPSALHMFGLRPEEIIGRNFIDFLQESEIPTALQKFQQSVSTGSPQSYMLFAMKRSDGSELLGELAASILSRDGVPYGTLGIIRDVTETKRVKRALLEEEFLLLRRIADNMLDIIILVDNLNSILYASPSITTSLGHKADDVTGKPVLNFIHQEDQLRIINAYMEDIATTKPRKIEFRCIHREGHTIWMEANVNPLLDDNGSSAGAVISLRDISESKLMANNLSRALDEKEGLLRELQHRVKNSFAIVTGIVSLEMGRHSDPDTNRVLEVIRNRISSLASLYDILHHTNDVKEIGLDSYLASMCRSLIASYSIDPDRIKFSLRLEKTRIDVRRAISIGLIANELLTNALKYAFPEKSGGAVRLDLCCDEDCLKLRVADDGVGMPADVTVENTKGLGLELVRLLTKQLGGVIEHEPVPGTAFSVKIPKSGEKPSSPPGV